MSERERGPGAAPVLGDMDPREFRAAAHRVADRVADYLSGLEHRRVLPDVRPGEILSRIPARAPARSEPLEAILADYAELIEPHVTHWQHPGFLAYFSSVACGPGILGEWLAAGLNSNVMFWKNAPASTELEQRMVEWLRRLLGLPGSFDGMLTDTASISSLLALVAARQAVPGLEAREQGLAGRPGVPRLRLYASAEAHASIEKAAIVIGVGRAGLRRIAVDSAFRLRPELLDLAIAEDRAAGWLPFCAVATLGSTSSASLDPAEAMAEICQREGLWFHVDAAYGGAVGVVPELRSLLSGWERADSIVFNPHKWLFTPFDASLLLFRRAELFREAFRVVPDYLRASAVEGARNYSEYGIQLGRRFRALKLWMLIRYFGADGLARRIREHCRLAGELAGWVRAAGDWELAAPPSLATICLRHAPRGLSGEALDRHNERILEQVNRSGRIYLSSTRLAGRVALRVSVGNPRTGEEHVKECWAVLQRVAAGANPCA
jgi:aromatic-L-amino-acid decarboxylase